MRKKTYWKEENWKISRSISLRKVIGELERHINLAEGVELVGLSSKSKKAKNLTSTVDNLNRCVIIQNSLTL